MRMICAPILFALCLLAACSQSTLTNSASCTTDAECGVHAYCELALDSCSTGIDTYTATSGHCHRDCMGGACACQSDADCPSSVCHSGVCLTPVDQLCPTAPCTAECPLANLAQEGCPICLCAVCPNPDVGNVNTDAGSDAGTSDGGVCTTDGACVQNSDCCSGYDCIIRPAGRVCCVAGGCP